MEGAGQPRFECPLDFLACPFSPGPPFSPEVLLSSSKQLWLITAPAHFSPESLEGRVVPLQGLQTLKAPQPDGPQKVYSIQAAQGDQGRTRLLGPSSHPECLACAPPFDGALSICERFGDPSGNQTLFPISARLAPRLPEGLKQRFVPFGVHLKRPLPEEAADEPPGTKKTRRLPRLEAEQELMAPSGEGTACRRAEGETRHSRKERQKEARNASLCALRPVEQDPGQSSSLEGLSQESLLSGAVEDQSLKKKKKKRRRRKDEIVGRGELQLDSWTQPSALLPVLCEGPDTPLAENGSFGAEGLDQRKRQKKRKHEEAAVLMLMDCSSVQEVAGEKMEDPGGLEIAPEAHQPVTADESTVSMSSHKRKKKKKKKKMEDGNREQERWPVLLDPGHVTQAPENWAALEVLPPGQAESCEHGLEGQKKKKTKKKKSPRREEGLVFLQQELK